MIFRTEYEETKIFWQLNMWYNAYINSYVYFNTQKYVNMFKINYKNVITVHIFSFLQKSVWLVLPVFMVTAVVNEHVLIRQKSRRTAAKIA